MPKKEVGSKSSIIEAFMHEVTDAFVTESIEHTPRPDDAPVATASRSLPESLAAKEVHSAGNRAGLNESGTVANEELDRLRAEIESLKRDRKALEPPVTIPSHAPWDTSHLYYALQGLSIREALDTVIGARWLIAGVVVLVILGTLLGKWIAGPRYAADALLQVQKTEMDVAPTQVGSDFFAMEAVVSEEIDIILSRSVLSSVVEQLQLDIVAQPLFVPIVGASIASSFPPAGEGLAAPWFGLNSYAWGGERITIKDFDVPVSYQGNGPDQVFNLIAGEEGRYQLFDPTGRKVLDGAVGVAAAARMPNGEPLTLFVSELKARPGTYFTLLRKPRMLSVEHLDLSLKVTVKGSDAKSGLISVRFVGTDPKKVAAIVNAILNTYVRQNVERKAADAERALQGVETQLPGLKQQAQKAEDALYKYRLQQGTADLTTETQGILEQVVAGESTFSQLKGNRQELLQKLGHQHPQVVALDAQIAALNKQLDILNGRVRNLPGTQQKILRLSRDVQVYDGLHTALLNKGQELRVAKQGLLGNVRVIDYAAVPFDPTGPTMVVLASLDVVLGVLVGIGVAFLRKTLRSGVQDPDLIEQRLGLPIYATVPHSAMQRKVRKRKVQKGTRHKVKTPAVLALKDPEDLAIESLRSLRTVLHFARVSAKNNVIMLTSSVPGVGKSFVTINLGVVLANAGERILIIDADLRKGRIHEYFGIDRKRGLSGFVAGDIDIDQLVQKTELDGLDVIPTGTIPPNPSELLLHKRFAFLLEGLASQYDYVLMDTPPILAVTDAAIIGRLTGVALLVVKSGEHPLREIEEAAKRLRQVGVNLCGVVFNDIATPRGPYGYGTYAYAYAYKR